METEGKNMESVTAPIAWLESEGDKKGKGEEMEEETDGLRKVGLRFLKSALSSDRVLKNEKEIKTESLLYGLS